MKVLNHFNKIADHCTMFSLHGLNERIDVSLVLINYFIVFLSIHCYFSVCELAILNVLKLCHIGVYSI